jgi:hypothetical protein
VKGVEHPTICIGRSLDRKGLRTSKVQYLLGNDIAEVLAQVAKLLP